MEKAMSKKDTKNVQKKALPVSTVERFVIPWVLVTDVLPSQCRKVLAYYKNKLGNGRIVLAERYTHLSVECNCEYDCNCDYDEKSDDYYLPAGWYEVAENHDEFGLMLIDDKITHWAPLPYCPIEG